MSSDMGSSAVSPNVSKRRGHAVLFPGQSPGLFGPFVQILYHLDSIGSCFVVTLVTPSRYIADLSKLQNDGSLRSIDLRLEEISGEIPADEEHPEFPVRVDSLSEAAFRETEPLRKKLTSTKDTPEAPTVIICDLLLPWGKNFADELGIPCYVSYHCAPQYTLMVLEYSKMLKDQMATSAHKLLPAEAIPDLVDPSYVPLFHSRDYPPEFFEVPEYMLSISRNTIESAGILMNTAEALDLSSGVLSAVKTLMGPSRVFCIGPAVQIPGFGLTYSSANIDALLPWLNSHPKRSVLYVAFGSLAVMSKESTQELAAALESSGVPFLLVLRTGSLTLAEIIPPGFEQRVSGRGRIETGWVNQAKILQHPAIGGYFTHCGWNSTQEGICTGVPFIGCAFGADQLLNERYLQDVAKIGIAISHSELKDKDIHQDITRGEIELAIRKLMLEEEGQRLRANVEKLQKLIIKAISEGGSSHKDFCKFFDQISSCN